MTGLEAAFRFTGGVCLTQGATAYDPLRKLVFLNYHDANGESGKAIGNALHEVAHQRQQIEQPCLFAFRHFAPVRKWLERDAWARAEAMAKLIGKQIDGGSRAKALSTYRAIGLFT